MFIKFLCWRVYLLLSAWCNRYLDSFFLFPLYSIKFYCHFESESPFNGFGYWKRFAFATEYNIWYDLGNFQRTWEILMNCSWCTTTQPIRMVISSLLEKFVGTNVAKSPILANIECREKSVCIMNFILSGTALAIETRCESNRHFYRMGKLTEMVWKMIW